MGYYVRLLSPDDTVPTVEALRSGLKENGRSESITIEVGGPDDWTQLTLAHADGSAIANIERNPVVPGELGAEEIREFVDEMEDAEPESAARWLEAYLPRVKCVYAFQILHGAHTGDGWGAIDVVRTTIRGIAGGIIQADGEGFSNEDGCHILWQFSDSVRGLWTMAVLEDGEWITFRMDLGNRTHRKAFRRGEVPAGIARVR